LFITRIYMSIIADDCKYGIELAYNADELDCNCPPLCVLVRPFLFAPFDQV